MARIRTIKPAFFRHEGLYDLEKESGLPIRVAFAGLWTAADREGRFIWRPRQLKLDCLPHDDVDFSRVLDALGTRGFILKYSVDGIDYGCIPSWGAHQVINNRESDSEIPPPPQKPETIENSTALTRGSRVDDASLTPLVHTPVEGEREGKGKGRERNDDSAVASPDSQKKPKAEWVTPQHMVETLAGLTEPVALGYLEFRRSKKAALTKLAWQSIVSEVVKSGMAPDIALPYAMNRGWQGFDAAWIKGNDRQAKQSKHDLSTMDYSKGVTDDGKF